MTTEKPSVWKKIGTGAALIVLSFGGAFVGGITHSQPAADLSPYVTQTSLDNYQNAITADLGTINASVNSVSTIVASNNEKLFADDAWESQAHVIALDELEHRDYRELGNWLLDQYNASFTGDEKVSDLNLDVHVKDVTYTGMNTEDKDGTVDLELKVYFEDKNGDKVKKYITATVDIQDDEADDLSFSETA